MNNYTGEAMRTLFTPRPSEVAGLNNSSYFYYRQQLYTKLHSVFRFTGLPENWDVNYIKDNLFKNGYIGIVENAGNIWPLRCSFTGFNVYNNPTKIMVSNPVFGSLERDIGTNGELLYINRVDGGFIGAESLIERYAILLAQCDASLNVTLMNSRVAHVFEAENDAEVATYKKLYDDVSQGKPAVFVKKGANSLKESNFNFLNVKNTYIGNDILITKRTIMNEFLTEIGINNANVDKRERLNADEVNANNGEISAIVIEWLQTMQKCCEKINSVFGLNIGVEFNEHIAGVNGGETDVDVL